MFGTLWDMFKWWRCRKDRKEDKEEKRLEKAREANEKEAQNSEKVETRLGLHHYSDTYDVQLEVVNVSEFSIPIKDVALHCIMGRVPCNSIFFTIFSATGRYRTAASQKSEIHIARTRFAPGRLEANLRDAD